MTAEYHWVDGIVEEGTGAASGVKRFGEYGGSINLQRQFLQAAIGDRMDGIHNGTINVNIAPFTFERLQSVETLRDIEWHPQQPYCEHFSLFDCMLNFKGQIINGLVYYPHPETKRVNSVNPNIMEVLAPYVPGIRYGEKVSLGIVPAQIELIMPEHLQNQALGNREPTV